MMNDLISRQAAIDATMETVFVEYEDGDPRKEESIILQTKAAIRDRIKALPSAQPTITHEQAVDYLHETGWLQNHDRILTESKADAKAEAIPLAWIKGYIVTCDLFDLHVNVPASKVIKTMVKIWEQENPGAKRGGTDAVNN